MNAKNDIVIGLGGSGHEGSAAIARGTRIEVAIEEERLTRRKYGLSWWWQNPVGASVNYCLNALSLELDDVERFVSSDLLPRRVVDCYPGKEFCLYSHHLCHAASAYMMLPPGTKAAILVYDGMGSIRGRRDDAVAKVMRETFGFFLADAHGIRCVGETLGPSIDEPGDFPGGAGNSIGKLYEQVTTILGFDENEAGKTMGLAAHGVPRFVDLIDQHIRYGPTYADCFGYNPFDCALPTELEHLLKISPSFRIKADIAASVQAVFERTLLHAASLLAELDHEVLCLAGGCALNSVANGRLSASIADGRRVLIPPYANDAGHAFGALWLDQHTRNGSISRFTLRGQALHPAIARPGRTYTPAECMAAAAEFYPRVVHDARVCDADTLANELAAGRVIGVLNGPSEIGPRALGGRSILADPRTVAMRERINRTIKGREPFRPLAPIILADRAETYFTDIRQMDPYMLKVATATSQCRKAAPAIVHIDGTARVQLVDEASDPFLTSLLRAFDSITGVPILLNTSFNRRGEPIVETPIDALDAFLGLELDGLFMEKYYFARVPNNSSQI